MEDSTTTDLTPKSEPDVHQLSSNEQAWAVAIVLGVMAIVLFIIIAWWPADPTYDKNALYSCRPFHVHQVNQSNQAETTQATGAPATNKSDSAMLNQKLAELKADIEKLQKLTDSASQNALTADKKNLAEMQDKLKNLKTQDADKHQNTNMKAGSNKDSHCTIQLGSLLLILVAAWGFLGNMIHVSKSLTYYIGTKAFQRSWIPWYFIKPFTASGLALLVYFATSSVGSGSTKLTDSINLFPIMLTAGLAGLFTDIAIKKLKLVFEAILSPADSAPKSPVKKASVDMSKVEPDKIDPNGDNKIKIPGENLDPKTVVVKINGKEIVKPQVTATQISFSYQPEGEDKTKSEFLLTVTDVSANLNAEKNWKVS